MSRNILALLLSALLLVQFSNSVPVQRQEVADYVFVESAKFIKDLMMEGKKILETLKEKAAKIETKNPKLSDYLERCDQYLERIKSLNEIELNHKTGLAIFHFFDSFRGILRRYEQEDFPTELTLKENGKEAYTLYFEQSFKKFSDELIDYLARYIAGLSHEEKDKEIRLINWFEKFKEDPRNRSLNDLADLLCLFDIEE